MCGIAGALGLPGATEGLVRRLQHRGPDHTAVVLGGELSIGAARLRVTGDARGDMPLASRSGHTQVSFNGEVFNHEDLYPKAAEVSDAYGLPDLLEAEGPGVLSRIRGPFALVATDARDGTLLVARDEVGVRPLFVREFNDSVVCASEVGPLAAIPPTPGRDQAAWDFLLGFQFWPEDRTPLEGVRPVAPGTWRRYRRVGHRLEVEEGSIAYASGEQDVASALWSSFRMQAKSALRTGLLLSGGLDSSAVAGMLRAVGSPPDVAVTGWFPGAPDGFDERPFARAAAEETGVQLHEVPITPDSYLEAWPQVLTALGGPLAGPGAVSQWLLCRRLSEEGCGVVFSGQGGDELFGGYERHRLLHLRDRGLPVIPAPGYDLLGVAAEEPDAAAALLFRGRELLPWLRPERRASVLEARRALPEPGPSLADRLLSFEIRTLLPGLLAVDDRTIAAFGMEGRVPLLDPVVARLARSVSLGDKSPPDAPRRLFREAVGEALPPTARTRADKMGFPVPLDTWLSGPWRHLLETPPWGDALEDVGFRPEVRDALRSGALRGRGAWFVLSVALSLEGAQTYGHAGVGS